MQMEDSHVLCLVVPYTGVFNIEEKPVNNGELTDLLRFHESRQLFRSESTADSSHGIFRKIKLLAHL